MTRAPSPAAAARLPRRVRAGYALGSVATGAFGTVPGLLLLPYLTDRLGVAAALAGLVVLVPKAWDVILNPIAGRISDTSTHSEGKRRPFLLRAGLLLAVLFALLFAGPGAPKALAAAWVVVLFLGCATAYAFFQVPYVAMPAELTADYGERTRLMTWRVAVLALAILVSGGVSPLIRDALGPDWGYRGVGAFVGGLIAFGAFGAWRGTASALSHSVSSPTAGLTDSAGLTEQLRLVVRERHFRPLLTAFVVQALATGCMLAGVDYEATWVVGRDGAASVLFACFVAPAVLVTPVWQLLGDRVGKKAGYLGASLILLAGALAGSALSGAALGPLAAAVAVVGVGYAGTQMFPLAMLADVAAVDAATTGENRIGVFTGVWTGAETLGLALGPGLYAAVLAAGGYVSSAGSHLAQSGRALDAIHLGFTLVPAVLVGLSMLAIHRYTLQAQDVFRASSGHPQEESQ
ncbi:MAG: MFS transporter [Tetrasphaera sp.]